MRFTNIFVDGCFQQAFLFISQVVIVFLGCLVPFFSLCFPFLASILVNDLSSAYSTSRTYHITHSFVLHHHRLLLFVALCRYILSGAIFLHPVFYHVSFTSYITAALPVYTYKHKTTYYRPITMLDCTHPTLVDPRSLHAAQCFFGCPFPCACELHIGCYDHTWMFFISTPGLPVTSPI